MMMVSIDGSKSNPKKIWLLIWTLLLYLFFYTCGFLNTPFFILSFFGLGGCIRICLASEFFAFALLYGIYQYVCFEGGFFGIYRTGKKNELQYFFFGRDF